MGEFAGFVLAAIGGFFLISGFGGDGSGFSEGEISAAKMECCMRQITANESRAR